MSFFALYDGSRVPRPETHIFSKKLLFGPKRYFFPGGRPKEYLGGEGVPGVAQSEYRVSTGGSTE